MGNADDKRGINVCEMSRLGALKYIYIYFEGVIFICRSDSQRIEHCDGTSEGIEHYFHNEFYRMLRHWMSIVAKSGVLDFNPQPQPPKPERLKVPSPP